jgi:hypothetical protein
LHPQPLPSKKCAKQERQLCIVYGALKYDS